MPGEITRVGRTGPAEGEHDGLSRIVATERRLLVDRVPHVRIGDSSDEARRLQDIEVEGSSDLSLDSPFGVSPTQHLVSTVEVLGVDVTKHDVGVRDGGLPSPLVVTGRSRV